MAFACKPRAGFAFILMLALACGRADARTLVMQVAAIDTPVASGKGLQVRLVADASGGGGLQVDVDALAAAGLGYSFRKLHWECPLRRDGHGAWSCAGVVRAGTGKPMRLALTMSATATDASLADGASRVEVQRPAANPELTKLALTQVPAAWLQAFVAGLWKDGKLQKGQLDGQLDVLASARAGLAVQGPLRLRDLALETPDGAIAGDGLNVDLRLVFGQKAGQRDIALDASLLGGQLLVGGLYAALPKAAIAARLRAHQAGGGDWIMPTLEWHDGAVLDVRGDAAWSPTAGLRALHLALASRDLAHLRDRYLTGWLDPAGLGGITLAGAVQATLAFESGDWRSLHAQFQQVDASDGKQRFALRQLAGDLRWSADATAIDSALRWQGGALFGIALGPATFTLRSQSRHLALAAPATIPLLGGALRLDRFDWTAPNAVTGARFGFGLSLLKLEVAQIAKTLGWPAFGGSLDGNLPSAHYQDNQLVFDGALNAQVFGGQLAITRLAMDRPFGVDPGVSADLDIRGFDLKQLTGVFGFGQITGRLDGSIRDLRLLDWTPIAFDARLHSDDKAPDRRRISQRAVADISSVGGVGLAAGLQAQALKIFQDFGYARLGISCRLVNNVCHMDGVGSAGGGYTILEGSGLPRIDVIGFARQVDWPTLVARLKAATAGDIVVK